MEIKIKKYFSLSHIMILLIIIIILFSSYSEPKIIKRNLINNNSEITIAFQNTGNNIFISNSYSINLIESIRVNGNDICDITTRTCQIKSQTKHITLKFKNSIINTCKNMFNDLNNITEIDMSNFDSSQVTSMYHMFYSAKNLKKITFGNMDTSLVQNMEGLFYLCLQLEFIDISNFVTSSVTNMKRMFFCCHELKSITFPKIFNTSLVTTMEGMFYHGFVLNSVDLSNFDTSEVTDMSSMFFYCYSLKNLNLSNFNTSKVTTIFQMFYNCKVLQYLDIKQFALNNKANKTNAFSLTNSSLRYCINDSNQGKNLIKSTKYMICSDTCYNEANIIIDRVNNKCVEICDNDTFFMIVFA